MKMIVEEKKERMAGFSKKKSNPDYIFLIYRQKKEIDYEKKVKGNYEMIYPILLLDPDDKNG